MQELDERHGPVQLFGSDRQQRLLTGRRLRRGSPIRLACVITCLGGSACGTSGQARPSELEQPGSDAILTSPLPFEERLGQAIGIDFDSIEVLLQHARGERAVACAADRGYALPEAERDALLEIVGGPGYVGGVQAIVDSAENDSDRPPELVDALDECVRQAGEEIGDPLASFREWEGVVISDLAAKVRADDGFRSALQHESNCIEEIGLGDTHPEAYLGDLRQSARDLVAARERGEVDVVEFEAESARLVQLELTVGGQLQICLDQRMTVERTVLSELEQQWLTDNSASLDEVGRDVRERLVDLGLI